MKTDCDCISKITKQLKERLDIPEVEWEFVNTVNIKTGEMRGVPPPLFFRYNKKKPDGKIEKKERRAWVNFTHCGFCGKPLKN